MPSDKIEIPIIRFPSDEESGESDEAVFEVEPMDELLQGGLTIPDGTKCQVAWNSNGEYEIVEIDD